MKRGVLCLSLVCIFVALMINPVLGKTYRIKFHQETVVNGVALEPGSYKLVLNGNNQAEIFKGSDMLVSAEVEVLPLGKVNPNSISVKSDRTLQEIRLKKERVVFVKS